LIHAFGRKTGVPILLNTSFNENEPIVLTPDEALDCFLRTDMDILVMGSHVLEKVAGGRRQEAGDSQAFSATGPLPPAP
jgi:carbamoyltransferase